VGIARALERDSINERERERERVDSLKEDSNQEMVSWLDQSAHFGQLLATRGIRNRCRTKGLTRAQREQGSRESERTVPVGEEEEGEGIVAAAGVARSRGISPGDLGRGRHDNGCDLGEAGDEAGDEAEEEEEEGPSLSLSLPRCCCRLLAARCFSLLLLAACCSSSSLLAPVLGASSVPRSPALSIYLFVSLAATHHRSYLDFGATHTRSLHSGNKQQHSSERASERYLT